MALYADLLGIPVGDRYPETQLTPAERKQRLLDALLYQLRRAAERGPVCLIVEDLHWIDPTSLEVLELGVEIIPELPIFLVAAMRPELELPWRLRAHVSTLTVNRLNRSESARIAEQVLGGQQLPRELLESIVERAVGIPLFVEELARSALDLGVIEQTKNGLALKSCNRQRHHSIDPARVPDRAAGPFVRSKGYCAGRVRDWS